MGIGSNEAYGIDMTEFDTDGFILRSAGNDTVIFGKSANGLYRAVREYAIAAEEGSASTLDIAYHEGVRVERLTIADRDISEFTVVYNDDRETVIPYESGKTKGNAKYAALELVRLVKAACGVELATSSSPVNSPMIVIDYLEGKAAGYAGFEYKVENGNLIINGGPDSNGCANAVYYIFEKQLGWDSLLFGNSYLNEAENADIPADTSVEVDPMFDFWQFWPCLTVDHYYDNARARSSQLYFGAYKMCNHGMVAHEWVNSADNVGGVTCYTSRANFYAALDKILAYIESKVEAGQVIGEDLLAIDLGMQDSLPKCLCRDCSDLFRVERAHVAPMVMFANEISDEVSVDFPGLEFAIMAYHAANNPPKNVRPNENVSITFATNGLCANHPMRGGECTGSSFDFWGIIPDGPFNNDDFAKWLKGWDEITDKLYVWHYAFGTQMHSMAYFENIYDDMMFIKECGVNGFFLNADVTGVCLGKLRFRLISEIIWHPDLTEAEYELRRDAILEEEYGEGWGWVLEFIEIWEGLETGCWNCWKYGALISATEFDTVAYAARAEEMYSLLEKAYALCRTPIETKNVGKHMAELLYRQCYCSYYAAYDAEDNEKLAYLNGQYEKYRSIMYEIGIDPNAIVGMGNVPFATSPTLEESAWIDWIKWRDDLTPEGTIQRPAPEGYEIPE